MIMIIYYRLWGKNSGLLIVKNNLKYKPEVKYNGLYNSIIVLYRIPWIDHRNWTPAVRSSIVTLIPSGLTSRILTFTELKGHCFVLVSGYVC